MESEKALVVSNVHGAKEKQNDFLLKKWLSEFNKCIWGNYCFVQLYMIF